MIEEKLNILLSKYFKDECSQEESEELQRFLANGKLKNSVVLRVLDRIEENEDLEYSSIDFDRSSILDRIRTRLKIAKLNNSTIRVAEQPSPRIKSTSLGFLRVAASVCLIALTSWFIYSNFNKKDTQVAAVSKNNEWKEIETSRGQTRTISMSDGSEIKLNVNSKIRFRTDFKQHTERQIFLDGEAFFDVASMPNKPFVVVAKGIETRVFGTSFNIDARQPQEDVKVAVVSGKVKVSELEGKDQLYLDPEEMAVWSENKIEKSKYDAELILAWTNKTLIFKKSSFDEVIGELENWYDVDVEINGQIKSDEYNGVHHNESLEALMKGLSFAGDFSYFIEGKKVTVTPN